MSISHCEDRAIAVAHDHDIGVDIERISTRDVRVVEAFASTNEREMIGRFPAREHDAWLTRLWCAKEAVGKLLGVGLEGRPLAMEAAEMTGDGQIVLSHKDRNARARVSTIEGDGFIIAYADLEPSVA